MKHHYGKIIKFGLIPVLLICMIRNAAAEEKPANTLMPQPPRHELVLDTDELTVFSRSVSDGLNKYGGNADFELTAAKGSRGTLWKVTIRNPRLPDVLKYWVAERSLEVVRAVSPDKLSPDDKTALKVVKSLADKIDSARNNPVHDEIRISGTITEENSRVFIKGTGFQYPVTGKYTKAIKEMKDKPVIMRGVVKVKDQIEATHVIIRKENTLELFVMSQCPFARKAEESLLGFVDALPDGGKPDISIRYIFYLKNNRFGSLHGEPEVMENLVQMVIRDDFRDDFHPYLLRRSEDWETPWRELAKEVGMSDETVQRIEKKIAAEREKLIRTEYNYAVRTYGVIDRSPAYVWESEIIPDIRNVDIFKNLNFSTEEKCSH